MTERRFYQMVGLYLPGLLLLLPFIASVLLFGFYVLIALPLKNIFPDFVEFIHAINIASSAPAIFGFVGLFFLLPYTVPTFVVLRKCPLWVVRTHGIILPALYIAIHVWIQYSDVSDKLIKGIFLATAALVFVYFNSIVVLGIILRRKGILTGDDAGQEKAA